MKAFIIKSILTGLLGLGTAGGLAGSFGIFGSSGGGGYQGGTAAVPELDLGAAGFAVAILAGGLLLLSERRKASVQA